MGAVYTTFESDFVTDADAVSALWIDNFATYSPERAAAKLRLGYLENPAGRGMSVLLRSTEAAQPVGVQCLHPRSFHLGDRAVRAANLADYTVAAAHRSLGPALMLMKHGIRLGQAGFDLLYGIPNKASAAVCTRAGLVRIGILTRFALVLSVGPYLERRLPAPVAHPLGGLANTGLRAARSMRHLFQAKRLKMRVAGFDDPAIDHAWQHRPKNLLLSERSTRMLQWRYADPARGAWQICCFSSAEGQPAGHVVFRMSEGLAEVGDFFCTRPAEQTAPMMLAFKRHARSLGAHAVSLEFLGPDAVREALQSVGFLPREDGAIVFRSKSPAFDTLPESAWYFTGFDNDAD